MTTHDDRETREAPDADVPFLNWLLTPDSESTAPRSSPVTVIGQRGPEPDPDDAPATRAARSRSLRTGPTPQASGGALSPEAAEAEARRIATADTVDLMRKARPEPLTVASIGAVVTDQRDAGAGVGSASTTEPGAGASAGGAAVSTPTHSDDPGFAVFAELDEVTPGVATPPPPAPPKSRTWPKVSVPRVAPKALLRAALGVIGLALVVAGIFAIFRPATPELGGTAMIVTGAALLVIVLLDRLPRRFAAGGIELDFSDDDARTILETVASEAPDVFDEIAAIVRRSATPAAAERVQALIAEASDAKPPTGPITAAHQGVLPTAPPQTEAEVLSVLAAFPGFRTDVAVPMPSGSRPPVVDAVVDVDETSVAIEVRSVWNPVIAAAVDERLRRALRGATVGAAVALVPADLVRSAEASLAPAVLVAAWSDVRSLAERVRAVASS